jgi:hypothetical protein
MARRLKKPIPKKIRRNPLARVLATGKFRNRVVKPAGVYRRRPKHPKPGGDAE